MVKCDKCSFEDRNVRMGDSCPECGQLVGYPVPDAHAPAGAVVNYDIEATDAELAAAVKETAERNFATLLRRKRQAEQKQGLNREMGSPPNAEPAAASDPSVHPQPDGEDDAEQDEAPSESDESGSGGEIDNRDPA